MLFLFDDDGVWLDASETRYFVPGCLRVRLGCIYFLEFEDVRVFAMRNA
jgi:hypothetical protein